MNEFIELVKKMRNAQVNYFKLRQTPEGKGWLIESKELEKQVDTLIHEHEKDNSSSKENFHS